LNKSTAPLSCTKIDKIKSGILGVRLLYWRSPKSALNRQICRFLGFPNIWLFSAKSRCVIAYDITAILLFYGKCGLKGVGSP
jgi:hypothetical protein